MKQNTLKAKNFAKIKERRKKFEQNIPSEKKKLQFKIQIKIYVILNSVV